MRLPVRVFLSSGRVIPSNLCYTREGPKLLNADNSEMELSDSNIDFSITDEALCRSISLTPDDRVEFAASIFKRKHRRESVGQDDLYPPSTNRWITYLSPEGIDATLAIQKVRKDSRYLLSVLENSTGNLVRFHPINGFEVSILQQESDWELYNRLFASQKRALTDVSLADLLDKPAPSWSSLGKLVEGVDIPELERKRTMGETVNQLVPKVFSERIRQELIAFLAWTTKLEPPTEDPLDFLARVNQSFPSGAILSNLVFGHTQCLIQGTPPPQYVRIMALVNRGGPESDLGPRTEETENDPWSITWYRISETFPDRKARVIGLAHSLNLRQEVHTGIPISREEAKKSKEAWLDRFSLIRSNLIMRGYVQDERLGLAKLVYIGGAHRWPHKHLQYTARLGNPGQKPPHIQVLVMPKTAVDRIMRTRQNIASIDWSASRLNYGLYSPRHETWKNNTVRLQSSLNGRRTFKQMNRQFDLTSCGEISVLSDEDARVLDLISWGIYNQSLELSEYDGILNMSKESLKEKLASFIQAKIANLQYFPTIYGLASICLEIRGEIPQLYSIARSTLMHLPTTTAMVSESSNLCVVMARVPEKRAYDILVDLPRKASEHDVVIKGYRVSAYAGYVNNLYQRLLLPDGTWDDDITGFLNQIRS